MSSQRVETQLQPKRPMESLFGDVGQRTGKSGIDYDFYFARAHRLRAEELTREARWVRNIVLHFMERTGVYAVRWPHYPQR